MGHHQRRGASLDAVGQYRQQQVRRLTEQVRRLTGFQLLMNSRQLPQMRQRHQRLRQRQPEPQRHPEQHWIRPAQRTRQPDRQLVHPQEPRKRSNRSRRPSLQLERVPQVARGRHLRHGAGPGAVVPHWQLQPWPRKAAERRQRQSPTRRHQSPIQRRPQRLQPLYQQQLRSHQPRRRQRRTRQVRSQRIRRRFPTRAKRQARPAHRWRPQGAMAHRPELWAGPSAANWSTWPYQDCFSFKVSIDCGTILNRSPTTP